MTKVFVEQPLALPGSAKKSKLLYTVMYFFQVHHYTVCYAYIVQYFLQVHRHIPYIYTFCFWSLYLPKIRHQVLYKVRGCINHLYVNKYM